MPMEIKDLDGGLGNLIEGKGFVTIREFVDSMSKHLTQDQKKFKKYSYSISDYPAVTDFDVRTEDIFQVMGLAEKVAGVNPDIIVAIVAGTDLIYGLSRMSLLRLGVTSWEIMVFRNREEAEAWVRKRVKEKYGFVNLTLS